MDDYTAIYNELNHIYNISRGGYFLRDARHYKSYLYMGNLISHMKKNAATPYSIAACLDIEDIEDNGERLVWKLFNEGARVYSVSEFRLETKPEDLWETQRESFVPGYKLGTITDMAAGLARGAATKRRREQGLSGWERWAQENIAEPQ